MTQLHFNTGSAANAGDGDNLRDAFFKAEENFSSLFAVNFSLVTGTPYTLVSGDDNSIIGFSGNTLMNVLVPSGLPSGFACSVIQLGTGEVTLSGSGAAVNSYGSLYSLAGQHASATLFSYLTDQYNLAGALTA